MNGDLSVVQADLLGRAFELTEGIKLLEQADPERAKSVRDHLVNLLMLTRMPQIAPGFMTSEARD